MKWLEIWNVSVHTRAHTDEIQKARDDWGARVLINRALSLFH